MAAPPLGQPSLNADQINAAYQASFGRAPTAAELASEQENANKYGAQGILNTIAARTNNTPGNGQAGTATWGSNGPTNPAGRSTAAMYQSPGYVSLLGLVNGTMGRSSDPAGVSTRAIQAEQLPPGVPPGSVPVNAGSNPDAWAYQTPDGRIIRGTRSDRSMQSIYGY